MPNLRLAELAVVALVCAAASFAGAWAAMYLRERPNPAAIVEAKSPAELYAGCGEEVAKFCSNEHTLEQLAHCLQKNKAQASKECALTIQTVNAFMLPCGPEIKKFCADVPLGEGRLYRCVKKEIARVGPECAKLLSGGS